MGKVLQLQFKIMADGMTKIAGALMRSEIKEAPAKYLAMLGRDLSGLNVGPLCDAQAIYTIARCSSDAAANILSYESCGCSGSR